MTSHLPRTRCGVVPPFLLEALASHGEHDVALRARRTLERDTVMRHLRGARSARVPAATPVAEVPGGAADVTPPSARRTVADAGSTEDLPGRTVRVEGDPASGDVAVDEAYDGLGATWDCYRVYGRDSVDGRGLPLLASVHYGRDYDNAFWDGSQMVFGDGDGRVFRRFTGSVDVIGHELTHGVTEHTAGLLYRGQSGALNESVSDVFGSIVKQRTLGQAAADADWLIGADLLTGAVRGVALRSLRAPGTAYDDPVLGKDPQPAHLDGYVETTEDSGGVHTNSGIPNHAFYLAATAIGGSAWEGAGRVWFDTLTGDIRADCDFATFARLTLDAARTRFGVGSTQVEAVAAAWEEVGVPVGARTRPTTGARATAATVVSGVAGAGWERPAGDPARELPDDPAAWTSVGPPPAPGAELTVRRTGGFAGVPRERHLVLGDLAEDDARDWQRVLASRELHDIAARPVPHLDAFAYRVVCPAIGVDVEVSEPLVPPRVRGLFERTLEPGG